MKKLLLIIFLGLIIPSVVNAQEQRFIEVLGEATLEVVPDNLSLTLTLNETDIDGIDIKTLDELEDSTKKFLSDKGVDPLSIIFLGEEEPSTFMMESKGKIRRFLIVLHDPKIIPDVMTFLYVLQGSSVEVSSSSSKNLDELKNKAQKEALENAKKKAINLLSTYGEKIGKVISIQEKINNNMDYMEMLASNQKAMLSKMFSEKKSNDYMITVEYSAIVRFAIQ